MNRDKKLSRRSFLRQAGALPFLKYAPIASALGASVAYGANCNVSQPKSLVCVFLFGGADTFNFVIPGGNQYDEYATTRGTIAVPSNQLLSASDPVLGEFSFNRLLPNLHNRYLNDQLAVIANVGNLIRPTTPANFSASTQLPQSLFAHNAQQQLWQTASGNLTETLGWGGSIAQAVATCNPSAAIATSVSINGSNAWLNNVQENYITLSSTAAISLMQGHLSSRRTSNVLGSLLAQAKTEVSPFEKEIANSITRAIDTTGGLSAALAAHSLNTFSPRTEFERQLHLVARLISAREQLNMNRQIFFVGLGGWDTHSNQNERLPLLLAELDTGLSKFQAAIDDLNKSNSVTTFTASDFGRSLTSNGDGTDHGWGGHAFVMGGAVDGGKFVGEFPSFSAVDNPNDASSGGNFAGRIIPEISVAQYAATLANWMGLSVAEQNQILPNLTNFSVKNLGFMK